MSLREIISPVGVVSLASVITAAIFALGETNLLAA